jgi:hypothetical protein
MPRPLRAENPGSMYPVMSRGARREAVFEEERTGRGGGFRRLAGDPAGRRGARTERARKRRETDESLARGLIAQAWKWLDGPLGCSPPSRRGMHSK